MRDACVDVFAVAWKFLLRIEERSLRSVPRPPKAGGKSKGAQDYAAG
jgi:hypothetical protein